MAPRRHGRDPAPLIARAIDRLGQPDFYDALLDILGNVAAHDLVALVRYSRCSPPDLILPRVEPNEAILSYHRHFHALDPFHLHWKDGGDTGVFRLRALASDIGRSRYALEFLKAMSIHDEIAVFLPPVGEASPTLILDRADGNFTPSEVARVRALFPLFAALHRRHLSTFLANGAAGPTGPIAPERPLRLVDQHGARVFATAAWDAVVADPDPEVIEALSIITDRGPCAMRLPGARLLRRTRLAPDFGAAPGGFCDEVTPDPNPPGRAPVSGLPASLARQLTDREQQVVLLTLRGWPVIEIAKKLNLSRGTVKNYRLAIYRKLDITSERELFGEYMAAVQAGPD
jgi:DNA-binding CsgD family transcriptional regulator